MQSVGPTVRQLYPQGDQQLFRRLGEVLDGQARCTVAVALGRAGGQHLVGVAVETPKGPDRFKLSTLWVDPTMRRRGVGRRLVQNCLCRWAREETEVGFLTVRNQHSASVRSLLVPFGFDQASLELNRYGFGEDELVLQWSLAEQLAAADFATPSMLDNAELK
ncbi:GNAT family N-acetyltransferase [Micromonospora sp. NPDC049580]|uniref:GNAT family N-acetyltransferase n=1 Tax=unclassified Micromonospora TaxID=2617518 RepID=UPI0033A457A9